MHQVLLLASENGALKGAKVGGIADVIRDLPKPLYDEGITAHVVMPSYGFLISQTKAELVSKVWVDYRSRPEQISIYRTAHPDSKNISIYLIDHPLWKSHPGKIYCDSGNRPFADDANRYALFSLATAEALLKKHIPVPDCIHLHDWHSSFFLLFSHFMPRYRALKSIDSVLTIHNLALQGIRPLRYDDSSLEAWFPELFASLTTQQLNQINDPRYSDCLNPLRCGINLAERIHVVSPTYASEILQSSDAENGFFGGEGLEQDLARKGRKLFGIINGCNYPDSASNDEQTFQDFLITVKDTVISWQGNKEALSGQDFIALNRLDAMLKEAFEPNFMLTSVGRLTDQKMLILRQKVAGYETLLDAILHKLSQFSDKAILILVGSGDPVITSEFRQVAGRWNNFLFLNGYAETLPDWLYKHGDLFLMPSSFEPCGISQMLAMREGQPCLVHGVGGLKDTVTHDKSGFVFTGKNLTQQADNLLDCLDHALATFQSDRWAKIKRSAKARRFSWSKVAKEMKRRLYRFS